jgi:prolyl-tRNA synthetase
MDRAGALEVLMPAVQPAELSAGVGALGTVRPWSCCDCKDRHQRDFRIGPTHEEVVADLARRELKQLPPAAGATSTRSR